MINFQETPKGFTLSFKGKVILDHSAKNPSVTLGTGEGKYNMSHGSFRIKDRVSARIDLAEYQVQESSELFVALLLGGTLSMKASAEGDYLTLSFKSLDPAFNRLWLRIPASESEHIYGCGEQYSVLDMRGRKVPVWVQEQGVGRGRDLITLLADIHSRSGGSWHTSYYSQPTFVSTAGYFCHVDSPAYAELDFTNKNRHTIHCWSVPEKIVFGAGSDLAETVGLVSGLLGRQPSMPSWAWDGVWLGVQGGTGAVRGKLKDARIAGVKVAALWAQDWEGRRITSFGKQLMWNWQYDSELYSGLPEFIKEIDHDGIKFMGYINPFLAVGVTDDPGGLIPPHFLYNEAREKNYCVKNSEGKDYLVKITTFPAAIVDLTNPEAFEWIKGVIKKNMISLGLRGWMADFGEYLPVDAVLFSGENPEMIHNLYPVLWARANMEAVREAGLEGQIAFFVRAGYSGTSKHAVSVWAGDQNVNWSFDDGLATVIPAALSLGFSGIGSHHSDIGGYTTVAWLKRSRELFMRWAEQAAFTQTMRTHEGNRPEVNWQFNSDSETLTHFARMSKIFAHIKTYHKHLADEYTSNGLPPMRHPVIHYEEDSFLNRVMYSYMYGRDLYVSPVIKPGIKKMKVYLPNDQWVHVWTGARFTGGFAEVEAPVGRPPVFYRSGSPFSGIFEGLRSI